MTKGANGKSQSTPVNQAKDAAKADDMYYCGMDMDGAKINQDDIGRRIAAKKGERYNDVTATGPIAPKTPRNPSIPRGITQGAIGGE